MRISIYVNLVRTFSQNNDFRQQSPYDFACILKVKLHGGRVLETGRYFKLG